MSFPLIALFLSTVTFRRSRRLKRRGREVRLTVGSFRIILKIENRIKMQTNIKGKPANVQNVCTVLKPPTTTKLKENRMKTTTQVIRFKRLGSFPGLSGKLVNEDKTKAEEEIVVAKKIKHEIK